MDLVCSRVCLCAVSQAMFAKDKAEQAAREKTKPEPTRKRKAEEEPHSAGRAAEDKPNKPPTKVPKSEATKAKARAKDPDEEDSTAAEYTPT